MEIPHQARPAAPRSWSAFDQDAHEKWRRLPPAAPCFKGGLTASAVFLMTGGGGGIVVLDLSDGLGQPDYLGLSYYCAGALAVGCVLFILHSLTFLMKSAEHTQRLAAWESTWGGGAGHRGTARDTSDSEGSA
jgi:hypothetical protein